MKKNNKATELLAQLNERQREAVEYCDGASLVVAGAGSGKTRVLTYKIAYLIANGIEPYRILALTFTNKAAKEMKARIGQLLTPEDANHLFMGTFHSIFSRILRTEAENIGYQSNFTIYDETDARSLLKAIIKEMELDEKKYKPSTIAGHISKAKNQLITAADYGANRSFTENDRRRNIPALAQIYAAYEARCRQANAMDFDDLLLNTHRLFNTNETVRQKYAERFVYVLVDEYQDTNFAQVSIVRLLAQAHQRVCVVGDDYQSIYSFRGANIDNILDFQNAFHNVQTFKLERNYRSTQRIVAAANSLMKHNAHQIPKEVYSEESEGTHLSYYPCYSDREEAAVVGKEIERLQRQESELGYDAFAILYRTNAQSRNFEEEFRRMGIPYKIYGGLSFYQRKEIKDIIAYFRLVANPNDEEAFKRIINYPTRGIGNTTVQRIAECAARNAVSLWTAICNPDVYGLEISKSAQTKIAAFVQLIGGFITELRQMDAYELGKKIIGESGIAADLHQGSDPEELARGENLEEFLSALQTFVTEKREEGGETAVYLSDYLQEVALYSDLDKADDDEPKVTMMTIHAAKGLEFPVVFVVGLEENIFPSPMSTESQRGIEEERRLLYVAITRAERHCILTNAKNRYRYGTMQFDNPSRFLCDIDSRFLDIKGGASAASVGHQRMPWEKAQRGDLFSESKPWNNAERHNSGRWQNANPVASQFKADPQPKLTAPRRPEQAINPFSARTQQQLLREGGNLRKVSSAMANGGRVAPTMADGTAKATPYFGNLSVGMTIEHQRFGIGKVLNLEGVGENAKATVEFRNAGTKQLLLKFAKFTILD
ncbi:MAG: UvrD-helicase domain-containing protein [Prevotella sp.]|nr:UvrD-helicase domain-containing protein [Prevotella sp.]MDY4218615.1 UvrD-helicase domain-containing protein [Prevotella sp.]